MKAGTFKAKPVEAVLSVTSGGKPQLAVLFSFVEDDEMRGTTTTAYLSFTDKTFKSSIESMREMGWKGDDISTFSDEHPEYAKAVASLSNPIPVTMSQEPDLQGNMVWKANLRGGIAVKTRMSLNDARGFAESLRAEIGRAHV